MRKVALVGASSTGKSTVFELLKNRLPEDFSFISESTRTVRSYGFPINEQGTDLTQLAISSFHLGALLPPGNVLYDRCYMDLLVYSKKLDISPATYDFISDTYNRVSHLYTHFIYFPIEFQSVDDNVRSMNEEWRQDIDKLFQECLQGRNFLTVTGTPLERVEQILNYINK